MKRYPVYCSWCEAEGRKTVVSMSEVEHSHGICPEHRKEQRLDMEIRLAKKKLEDLAAA